MKHINTTTLNQYWKTKWRFVNLRRADLSRHRFIGDFFLYSSMIRCHFNTAKHFPLSLDNEACTGIIRQTLVTKDSVRFRLTVKCD